MRIDGRLDGNTQRDSSHPDIAGGQSQDARRGSFRGDTIMVVPDELSRLDNA